jgi:hypothetical protein
MSALPADLAAVAAVNPVSRDSVAGELQTACATELRYSITRASQLTSLRRSGGRRHRAIVVVAILFVASAAGVAIAARLYTHGDEERFLPQGSVVFAGTQPECVTVEEGVSYRCRLARAPTAITVGTAEHPAFKGSKFGTVGDDGRVNGGCIALDDGGTDWACYLGERAVVEGILDKGVLGQEQAGPASG